MLESPITQKGTTLEPLGIEEVEDRRLDGALCMSPFAYFRFSVN